MPSPTPRCCFAAILAGGASRRMGSPKALLPYDGQALIARTAKILRPLFHDVVVITADAEIAAAAHLPAVPDIYPGKGPLAGIHAALQHFNSPVFCFGCDMPHLNRDFISYMLALQTACDAVVPRNGEFYEPLHAIYSPACRAHFETELQGERVRSMQRIIGERTVYNVDEAEARRFDITLQMFENWNTPGDIAGGASPRK